MSEPQGGRSWLVTGAAGFIGCNVVRELIQRGNSVVGVDNFSTGKRDNIDRLSRAFGQKFKFIQGDIVDPRGVDAALDGCSHVLHLAGQVSVPRSIEFPEETHAVNTTGFMNVFRAAASSGVEHLIYASSCSIYGDNPQIPLAEDAIPRPLSPYAASKLANEAYAMGFATLAPNMAIVGLRLFNIFGPWQNLKGGYAAVIPAWIDALLAGNNPQLYGDGSATRDFCHVDNVCAAILCAASLPRGARNLFNVATGVETRLDELYAAICRVLHDWGAGPDLPKIERRDLRPGDILHSVGDTGKASRELGFRAGIDLENGLRKMLVEQYGK